ncbi:hypothetical protein DUNSADRAFT_10880 [Dunaliella salina]|uniref:Small nuclear ribonucleoprotein Prp3 C-terminal domain-containing protein n=1 Tax=Dunaliella salina TaxID=3046 RepID=A0ABQ7HA38_DUNSA|nr:hypothetical protein DUNSADRAFT_10880 [Dunaliella salina]|eukprot:KAF5843705.1 hypothetical protein DUNSADRAFT_10880 [Dunaliella salina]
MLAKATLCGQRIWPRWASSSCTISFNRLPLEVRAASNSKGKKSRRKSANTKSPIIVRQAIWFHHILNKNKRKVILQWAKELQLSGASKIGYPGVIVLEGHADDVQDYTARLRALPWAAMQVRAREEEDPMSSGEVNKQGVSSNGSNGDCEEGEEEWRRLPYPLIEIPDTGLSLLGAMCKDAQLGHLFAAALKLHSPADPSLRQ